MSKGRVLCVTSNFPRWSGDSTTPFVLHLAQDLQSLGWEVHVLAPHAPQAARMEVISGVQVKRFRYLWPIRQQTVCYQGGALINLRKHPANWLKLPALVAAETLAIVRQIAYWTVRLDALALDPSAGLCRHACTAREVCAARVDGAWRRYLRP